MKLLQVSLLFTFVMLVAHVAAYNLGSLNRRYDVGKPRNCTMRTFCINGSCLPPTCYPNSRRGVSGVLPKPLVPLNMTLKSRVGPHHTETRVQNGEKIAKL